MAKAPITITMQGMDLCEASIASIGEALANAGRCDEAEFVWQGNDWVINGWVVARLGRTISRDGLVIIPVQPCIGMTQLVVWIQSFIATQVEWVEGWPMLRTSPKDDDDEELEPVDSSPNMLAPA